MKRALFLLIAIISVFQAAAQEADLIVANSQAVTVDSLLVRLNKLQHDYEFLRCDYELYKTTTDLKLLSEGINNSSNSLITYIYNERYNKSLYQSYADKYESDCTYYDALVNKIEFVRVFIVFKMFDFSEAERDLLNSGLGAMQRAAEAVESSLNHFDVALKTYKRSR